MSVSHHNLFVNKVRRVNYFFFICDTLVELRCGKGFIKRHLFNKFMCGVSQANTIILRSASFQKSLGWWSSVSLWSNFIAKGISQLVLFTSKRIVFIKILAFMLSNKRQLPALLFIRLSLYRTNNVLKVSLWYRFIVPLATALWVLIISTTYHPFY